VASVDAEGYINHAEYIYTVNGSFRVSDTCSLLASLSLIEQYKEGELR